MNNCEFKGCQKPGVKVLTYQSGRLAGHYCECHFEEVILKLKDMPVWVIKERRRRARKTREGAAT